MLLNINEIKVNPGRRELSQSGIEELAQSIADIGLLSPVSVDEEHTLIAGYHRLEAAKRLGWTEIECSVCKLKGLQAELAEIDENFVRTALTATQRGELLLRRKTIYETLHPETRHGMRNGQTAKDCSVQSLETKYFVQDTTEKLGVSPSTVSRQVQVAKNTTPEAKQILQDSDVDLTQQEALKLSRLEPVQQKEAAAQLASKQINSVDEYQTTEAKTSAQPVQSDEMVAEESAEVVPESTERADGIQQDSEVIELFTNLTEFLQTVVDGIKTYSDSSDCFAQMAPERIQELCLKSEEICLALREFTAQLQER